MSTTEATNPLVPLAELIATARYEHLPPRAVECAKMFLLDTMGVGVAGSTGPRVNELLATVPSWGQANDATAWVDGRKLPAASAAIANGYQIHALEWDCVHEPAVVHPMATLIPALLAHAERRGNAGRPVSGKDLILATALGVEIAAMIGAASKSVMRFFRPATCGGFGVVAGVGSMERLDVPTLMNAFGIQYGQTSGTMQAHVEGSLVLGMQVGFNSRAGLTSIDLASAGLPGPHDVLTGMYGYYKLFESEHDIPTWWAKLGREWQITQLSHKPFPSGRLTHAAIDAVQRARLERNFAPEDIASISCSCPPLAYRLVGRPDIPNPTPNYARLCIPFVIATTLVDTTVDPEAFRAERLSDPRIHAIASKVTVTQDANPDVNALWPQHLVIKLNDGWTWERTIEYAIGHPRNPLSHDRHLAKFRKCWQW
ncbi:MAG: MmgE/PrpD family protein, partial [Burkholderiales bacterium]